MVVNCISLKRILYALFLLPCIGVAQTSLTTQWVYTPVTPVEAMTMSPDGKWVAIGGFAGVQVYRQSTHQLVLSIPSEVNGLITSLAISPDGTELAIGRFEQLPLGGYKGAVELRSIAAGKLIEQLPTSATFSIDSVAFSADGRTLADGARSYDSITHTGVCTLELWNLKAGYKRSTLPTTSAEVSSIAFSKSGTKLLDGGYESGGEGSLELWNLKTSKLIESFSTIASQGVTSVALTPDEKTVIDGGSTNSTISTGVVEEWNVATGKLFVAPATAASQIVSITVSPDGKSFADSGTVGSSGLIETWSVSTGGPVTSTTTGFSIVQSVLFSPDGKFLIDGGSAAVLETRNSSTLKLTSSVDTALYTVCESLAFSANGKTIASASYNKGGTINLWNAETGKLGSTLDSPSHRLKSVALASDNKTLAACGQATTISAGVLELWDYTSQKLIANLPTSAKGLASVQFSPDGKSLADGGFTLGKGVVELWDVSKKQLVSTFPTEATSVSAVAYSPDGTLIAVGGYLENTITFTNSGVVELWNINSGKKIDSFVTAVTEVSNLSFSPDGKSLAVGGLNQVLLGSSATADVEIWNIAKGVIVGSPNITAGSRYVLALVFSNNGKDLYVGTDVDLEAFATTKFSKPATFSLGGISAIAISKKTNLMALYSVNQWMAVSYAPY